MNEKRSTIENMPTNILYLNAYLTQLFLLCVSGILIWLFYDSVANVFLIRMFDVSQAMILGSAFAIGIMVCEWILMKRVSKDALDDGGINKRLFGQMSLIHMVFFCLFVSIVEELLFRAVLQSLIGLIGASLLFAIVHVRYVTKPILFSVMIAVSFSLGLLFHWTNNILAPITAHFLINFISGLYIKFSNKPHLEG